MRNIAYALLTVMVFVASPVYAQKIAVADADYIMNQAEAAKSIKSQLKAQQDKFQADFQAIEKSLQEQEKAIVEKRPNLTEEEFKKQIIAFRQKMAAEDQKFKQKQANANTSLKKALAELEQEIGLAVQQIAKEKGYTHVLSKQNILFAAAGQPDITQDVLKAVNAKKKTIQIKAN